MHPVPGVVALGILVAGVSGCGGGGFDPAPPPAFAGLRRVSAGTWELRYRLCAPAVARIELREAGSGGAVEDLPLLWRIDAQGDADPSGRVTVGLSPPGFRQQTPLTRDLATVPEVIVSLEGGGRDVGVQLHPAHASTEAYAVNRDRPMSIEEFDHAFDRACRNS